MSEVQLGLGNPNKCRDGSNVCGSKVKEASGPDKKAKTYRLQKDHKIDLLTEFETMKQPNK